MAGLVLSVRLAMATKIRDFLRVDRWLVNDPLGETALMEAARADHLDVVQCLVNNCGADANATSTSQETGLIEADREGHINVMQCLVSDGGSDVNIQNNDGATALLEAARGSHLYVVQCLANDGGSDVNPTDTLQETVLLEAANGEHHHVVRWLVSNNDADVNATDTFGETGLIEAARRGHLHVVQCLVNDFDADVNATDSLEETALIEAARGGHLDVVQFLVNDGGADVSVQDNDGASALITGARGGHLGVVQWLVNKGNADVNIENKGGRTALIEAARGGHLDVVECLVNDGGADVNPTDALQETALMKAARAEHLDVVRWLVNNSGADVNATDAFGETVLIEAARGGHLDVVQLLVNGGGADVSIQNHDGATALMKAADRGHLDVVRWLVNDGGADVNIENTEGRTALIEAARRGHLHVVQCLVNDCSADVNATDSLEETALIEAAHGGHLDVVQFLVNDGDAEVSAQNNDGASALIKGARGGHLGVVQWLVNDGGADVNIENNDGATALIEAARGGHLNVVQWLVNDGCANVNIQNNYGATALMKAARGGHLDVVQCLVNDGDADVSIQDGDGWTVLTWAADHVDVVQWLVNKGGAGVYRDRWASSNLANIGGRNGLLTQSVAFEQQEFPNSDGSRIILPDEVELGERSQWESICVNFQAKWLDADAGVKLLIPDASFSLVQYVDQWGKLRHPNILKLYGVCQAGPMLNMLVCEYASNGSLIEYVTSSSLTSRKLPLMWKYLHEAALGLEYLHERGIIHGNLRCLDILLCSDRLAKLSNFGLAMSRTNQNATTSEIRWQAPEVVSGGSPSRESDVYSLGMCILEAESKQKPWSKKADNDVKSCKLKWNSDHDDVETYHPGPGFYFINAYSPYFIRHSRDLVERMCRRDPRQRPSLLSIISELERLAIEESADVSQPELEPQSIFDDLQYDEMHEQWMELQRHMSNSNADHVLLVDKLKRVYDRLVESKQSGQLIDQFYSLFNDTYQAVTMTPDQVRTMHLTSTKATTTSMYSLHWRIDGFLKTLGEEEAEVSWQQQRSEQAKAFLSGITDTVLLLQGLQSVEEKAAFLQTLKTEMANPQDKYTDDQLATIKSTYEEIEKRLEGQGDIETLTPEWFIPWYELIVNERKPLGEGGFGIVYRARWLDSDVVVKQMLPLGSNACDRFCASFMVAPPSLDPESVAKRTEARAMFRREADTWFGFSHPHVIRLFGACHVGRPFFVCEYATYGTLDKYLQTHPDEIWTKLREAALGVQYLHARGFLHRDLKCNNIMIGSDLKAKVTDFGLSSAANSKISSPISAAWNWVAPECLKGDQSTFASDVYSLGMCIVEALRVVEALPDKTQCLPWGNMYNEMVKFRATRGVLPPRPKCEDGQWALVQRMCSEKPEKRIKISTVVDELERWTHTTDSVVQGDNVVSFDQSLNTAQQLLREWQTDTEQREEISSSYNTLWNHLKTVYEPYERDTAFQAIVKEAHDSTVKLECLEDTLIPLAQATMKSYALRRRLVKLCEANFI